MKVYKIEDGMLDLDFKGGEFVRIEHYTALQQKLDRLQREYNHVINQHMPRTSEGCDEGWSRVIEAQELQQKLDAMAAENAALKCKNPIGYVNDADLADVADGHVSSLMPNDVFGGKPVYLSVDTPATDAYLNSVRADTVEVFTSDVVLKMRESGAGTYDYADIVEAQGQELVLSLRSGTHDTADKEAK